MFKELKERWNSESPKLFKTITNICIIIGSVAFGILSANGIFNLDTLVDPIIFKVCGYILTVCGGMGLTSKITKKDVNSN